VSGRLDTEPSNLPLYLAPFALVLAIAAVPRGIRTGKRLAEWYAKSVRAPGDLRPGHAWLEVESDAINLGHSEEGNRKHGPSATPTLDAEELVLRVIGGPRIRIEKGAKLEIKQVTGAQRKLVDSTTTQTGMRNRYSFEVRQGARFWLLCELSGDSPGYREADVIVAKPIKNKLVADENRPSPPNLTRAAIIGGIIAAAVGFFLGMFITMGWRTGCASGKYPIPDAAFIDALSIAILTGTMGLHIGIANSVPDALTTSG
jgi:hypothetical protein